MSCLREYYLGFHIHNLRFMDILQFNMFVIYVYVK